MSGLTVYTDSLGGRPANTTLTVTNIRFTEGAGCDGLRDGDSTGLQSINGDPIALVADATDPDTVVYGVAGGSVVFAVSTSSLNQFSAPMAPIRTIRSPLGGFLRTQAVDASSFAAARGMT